MGVAARHPATAMGTWSGWALSRAGPSLLSDWGLGSASPSLPHHPFESSISSPDLPRVTDRNGRVLSKMPGAGGQDNKVCFVSKQAGEGSPLPPALASVPPGAARAPSCDLGQPAAPSALSACRPRVRVSGLSVNCGTHDALPAPQAGSKARWPEGAELPFHSSSRNTTLSTKAKPPPRTRKAPRLAGLPGGPRATTPPSLSPSAPRDLGSLLPVPRVALPISRGRSSEASGGGRGVRAAWQIPSERQGGARPSPSGSPQDQVSASRRAPGGMG